MAITNRHGLSRYVPAEVARAIRQRCGFGCVLCGLGFYDYEHFDPDFADATEHNPLGMTLLCMQCNQKRARGTLSREAVASANADPACKRAGFARECFDVSPERIAVQFAAATFVNCRTLIEINRLPVLAVAPPMGAGEPYRLSGYFTDATGTCTLTIKDNVWKARTSNWDVECVGARIAVRRAAGDIALIVRTEPPHRLVIERIDMQFEGCIVRGDERQMKVSCNGGRGWTTLSDVHIEDCGVGICLQNTDRYAGTNDPMY